MGSIKSIYIRTKVLASNDIVRSYQIAVALIIFLVISTLVFNYVMNHIYVQGSGMLDVGWFTYLLSNSHEFPPRNPAVIGSDNYFSTHISPFLYLTSALYVTGQDFWNGSTFFSLFMGFVYGITSLSVFIALSEYQPVNIKRLILIGFISVAAGLNGVALGAIGFPHFEMAIPALLLLMIALYIKDKKILLGLTFILLLSIREDAGLHAFLLFFSIFLAIWIQQKKVVYPMLFFALAALGYSALTMILKSYFFPGDNAFSRIYSGPIFYGHLTLEFLKDKTLFFITNRAYIWAPCLLSIYLSVVYKKLIYMVGFLSVLPWTMISLSAYTGMANTLSNYYAFPFVISSLWPVFAGAISLQVQGEAVTDRERILIYATPILSFFLFYSSSGHGLVDSAPWRQFDFEYKQIKSATDTAVLKICQNKHDFGNLLVDESVSALMPECVSINEWGFLNVFTSEAQKNADSIIFYSSKTSLNGGSVKIMISAAMTAGIEDYYKIPGTSLLIATKNKENRPLGLNLHRVNVSEYLNE